MWIIIFPIWKCERALAFLMTETLTVSGCKILLCFRFWTYDSHKVKEKGGQIIKNRGQIKRWGNQKFVPPRFILAYNSGQRQFVVGSSNSPSLLLSFNSLKFLLSHNLMFRSQRIVLFQRMIRSVRKYKHKCEPANYIYEYNQHWFPKVLHIFLLSESLSLRELGRRGATHACHEF